MVPAVHAEGEPQQCHWIVVDEESVQAKTALCIASGASVQKLFFL